MNCGRAGGDVDGYYRRGLRRRVKRDCHQRRRWQPMMAQQAVIRFTVVSAQCAVSRILPAVTLRRLVLAGRPISCNVHVVFRLVDGI
jgi:hypothetical protein